MAKTSALGYIAAKRQSVFGTAVTPDTFFRYLSAPTSSAEATNNRYREGGGGRDITLSLKEGIMHNVEFPVFARATIIGFLLQAATGPTLVSGGDGAALGGGTMSNGLYDPPTLAGTPVNTTLSANVDAGATEINLTDTTGVTAGDELIIGWGANAEWVTVDADWVSGNPVTLEDTGPPIITAKFAHAALEPCVEPAMVGYVGANYLPTTHTTTLTLAAGHTFVTGIATDELSVLADADAAALGKEFGQAEIVGFTTVTVNDVTLDAALAHSHSAGALVYQSDETNTTTKIHGFEPMTGLGSALDYFTVGRAVGTDIVENIQDCKLTSFEISGEAPGPIRLQVSWTGRFGNVLTTALTEDYTNQDPEVDIPFRMPDGRFNVLFGSSSGISTELRQFTWNASNIVAEDIFTDSITRDDILDLARESNFSAQFYFNTAAEYYEVFYGDPTPTSGEGTDTPSSTATSGDIVLSFSISATERLMFWVPSIVWETFPVEIDPEPKPIIVDAVGVPLKSGSSPLWLAAVQNKDVAIY